MAEIIDGAGRFADPGPEGTHWVEHLRSEHLSVGTYSIAAGSDDAQVPHREDEIYLVTAGTARFTSASRDAAVGPGSVVFVPAEEEHRFADVSADFATVVVFAPPEQP
jgi:mannose-6-phosphate isomerase-like protein (cupin superfamily)